MAVVRLCLLAAAVLAFSIVTAVASRVCRPGGRTWQWLGPFCFRTILRLLRLRLVTTGAPSTEPPVLLVANHVSWLDTLVLGAIAPFTMLAKREVGSWPVVAGFARLQGTVLVDRSRRMQVPAVNRALADRLAAGHSILFFPEGTTHDGTRRGRFLTSHFACPAVAMARHPDRPAGVQAAALRYSDPAAAWVGDAALLPHLWTVLRRPGITCEVVFGAARAVAPGYDRKVLGRHLAQDVEMLLEGVSEPVRTSPSEITRDDIAANGIAAAGSSL